MPNRARLKTIGTYTTLVAIGVYTGAKLGGRPGAVLGGLLVLPAVLLLAVVVLLGVAWLSSYGLGKPGG